MSITLAEINDTLKSQKPLLEKTANGIETLAQAVINQQRQSGAAEEARRERIRNTTTTNNVSGIGGILASPGIGIGAALAGAGGLLSGLGSAGAGIGAFFLGLAGAEAIMSKFGNGENLKALLGNLAEGLGAFGTPSILALGGLFAGASLFGAVAGVGKSFRGGLGIAAIGAGIAAFLAEMSIADAAIAKWGGDGSALSTFLQNFAGALNSLTPLSGGALAGLLVSGGLFGAVAGVGKTFAGGFGIAAIGAGIAAFFTSLAAGDWAIDKLGADGSSLKMLIGNLVESISLFTPEAAAVIGGLIAAGGIFGPAMIGAAVGMGGIGTGIGLFFAGIAVGDAGITAMSKLTGGTPGEGFKNLLINTAEGIEAFGNINIDATKVKATADSISSVSGAILTFFGVDTVAKIKGISDELAAGLGKALDAVFGTNFEGEARKGAVERIIESFAPIKNMDIGEIKRIDLFSDAVSGLTESFNQLSKIKAEGITVNLEKMLRGVGALLSAKDALINGKVWDPDPGLFGSQSVLAIDFGKGLKNFTADDMNTIKEGVSKLYTAMSPAILAQSNRVSTPANISDQISGKLKDLYVETIQVKQGLNTPAINIVDASSNVGPTSISSIAPGSTRPSVPKTRNDFGFYGPQ